MTLHMERISIPVSGIDAPAENGLRVAIREGAAVRGLSSARTVEAEGLSASDPAVTALRERGRRAREKGREARVLRSSAVAGTSVAPLVAGGGVETSRRSCGTASLERDLRVGEAGASARISPSPVPHVAWSAQSGTLSQTMLASALGIVVGFVLFLLVLALV